nr:twin-arginine translocation signal domain-containing protein [Halogranum amylolyticum]
MTSDLTRRRFLATSAVGGVVGTAGCSSPVSELTEQSEWPPNVGDPAVVNNSSNSTDVVDVRGAIYIPSRAYNIYQMWQYYEPEIIERDLTYATQVNLNAIRTWVSYEAWQRDPDAHEQALDHFLQAADDRDLSVLLGLFDAVGSYPTEERLEDTDPASATGLSSPPKEVLLNRQLWDGPRRFVRWFMDNYRDDDRLLGIEAMNEPGWMASKTAFAREMFATLVEQKGRVPLTVGSTSLANNAEYEQWGNEILQFHYNFVNNQSTYRTMLQRVNHLREAVETPVWLTEWQRTRHGRGFAAEPTPSEQTPNYASLAPLIRDVGIGNFFWSLMVKPAWVQPQRKNGVINGLFHEDGAVWSREDARAIKAMSGDASFDGEERSEWPEWAEA